MPPSPSPQEWYRLGAADAAQQLGSEPARGLSAAEVSQRLAQYGLDAWFGGGYSNRKRFVQ